jgi:hypothetical protein
MPRQLSDIPILGLLYTIDLTAVHFTANGFQKAWCGYIDKCSARIGKNIYEMIMQFKMIYGMEV